MHFAKISSATPKLSSVRTAAIAALTLATLAAAGCETDPARQRSTKALDSLNSTRNQFVAARAEVANAVTQLGKLEAKPANLTPAFHAYQGAVADVEKRSGGMAASVADIQRQSATYTQTWADENQKLNDPSLRQLAEARNARVKSQYDRAIADAQDVQAAYGPLLQQLKDLELYLSNDLTYASVEAARPKADGARARAGELTGKIDTLIADVDETTSRLSPTTQPTK